MYVKVDKDKISSELSICDDAIAFIEEERKKLSSLVGNMGEIWKGRDYNAFSDKMICFSKELESFEEQLTSYVSFVNGYLMAENELDKCYKNKKISLE